MIDIHPPHHAATTRRDFFIHLFTVVLGILIAIGLEQTVEYLHHRHLATEARRALLAERDINEISNDFNIFATKRHQRDLQHDLAVLHALRAHQSLPPGPFIVRHIRYLYPEDEWRKLHQSGTINYLTENLGPVDYRYTNQDAFMARIDRSTEDLYRATSVLRMPSDPLNTTFEKNLAFDNFLKRLAAAHENLSTQEVDAEFATLAEPANFSILSPAQIDFLERSLQSALADDDALLTYCYNIKRNLRNNPQR
jgi:hypothetical protein